MFYCSVSQVSSLQLELQTPAPFLKADCVFMQGVVEPHPLPQTMGADGLQGGVNVGWVKTDICKEE